MMLVHGVQCSKETVFLGIFSSFFNKDVVKKKKKKTREDEGTLLVPDFPTDQVKISRALLGLEHQCSNSASPENSEPAEDNLYNIRILLYPQPN